MKTQTPFKVILLHLYLILFLSAITLSVGAAVNGYEVTRSTGSVYTSIFSTGNAVTQGWRNGTNTDDNLSNAIPIGFNFDYDGSTYSSFLVSINGFITFNVGTPSTGAASPYGYQNSVLYSGTAPTSNLLIAPFYEDIVTQGNPSTQVGLDAGIKYELSGSPGSQVLTVEWIGMELWNREGPNFNFQVKLYETSNKIEFVYGLMEGFGLNGGLSSVNYTYNAGINSATISATPNSSEVMSQLTANSRNFGYATTTLAEVADCYSTITFDPGVYTPYVPPVSLAPVNDSIGAKVVLVVNPYPCVEFCGRYYTSSHATRSLPGGCATADDDVWFEFVATAANTNITVVGSGNYDPTIELMNTSYGLLACANSGGVNLGSTEVLTSSTLVPGTTYYVRVYEKLTGSGTNSSGRFAICVSEVALPPSNDECANAIDITVTGLPAVFSAGTSTIAASPSAGIPTCSVVGTNPDDDVWYKFTAANSKEIIAVNSGTGFNAVIQAFSGTCGSLSALSCVNTFSNGQSESISLSGLTRNDVYYFRVYHAPSSGGTGNYSVSVSSPPPVCTGTLLPPNGEFFMTRDGISLTWDPVFEADNYKILFDSVNPPTTELAITTDTTYALPSLEYGTTYYWSVQSGNATGFTTNCTTFHFETQSRPFTLYLRLFLEGYYAGGQTMKPYLSPADSIVDTIQVDLIDIDTAVNFSERVLLRADGWAVVPLPVYAIDLEYYYVVKHRNHLETWSLFTLFDVYDTIYDFTEFDTTVVNNYQVEVEPGVWAFYYGDINQDGAVNLGDVGEMKLEAQSFLTGYVPGDLDGDDIVGSSDASMLENQLHKNLMVQNPFFP